MADLARLQRLAEEGDQDAQAELDRLVVRSDPMDYEAHYADAMNRRAYAEAIRFAWAAWTRHSMYEGYGRAREREALRLHWRSGGHVDWLSGEKSLPLLASNGNRHTVHAVLFRGEPDLVRSAWRVAKSAEVRCGGRTLRVELCWSARAFHEPENALRAMCDAIQTRRIARGSRLTWYSGWEYHAESSKQPGPGAKLQASLWAARHYASWAWQEAALVDVLCGADVDRIGAEGEREIARAQMLKPPRKMPADLGPLFAAEVTP